jgi:hypothetical protein
MQRHGVKTEEVQVPSGAVLSVALAEQILGSLAALIDDIHSQQGTTALPRHLVKTLLGQTNQANDCNCQVQKYTKPH